MQDAMMLVLMLLILVLLLSVLGLFMTLKNIWTLIRKKKCSKRSEILSFSLGIIFMTLLYLFWDPKPWYQSVVTPAVFGLHEPFAREHILTLAALFAVGLASYIFLKKKKDTAAPLAKVLAMAGVYLGIADNVLIIVQLSKNVFAGGERFETFLMALVPLNCVVLALALLTETVREQGRRVEEENPGDGAEPYKSRFLNDCNRILAESRRWALYALLLTLPLLCVIVMILLLFGQKPDSVIRAFTETSDWTLSTKIAPPDVELGAHYLCTVAQRGHKRLVRPMRMGLRRGERIVVNRQLCVANAFEQLLEERMPRFHRAVRRFYDTYGYPVSRHIRTPLAADAVYLMMKPLEWLFVAALYLFDAKPEDRIARQYLPKI